MGEEVKESWCENEISSGLNGLVSLKKDVKKMTKMRGASLSLNVQLPPQIFSRVIT